ncbi:hypothetical protein Scep_004619 [Stephania cephalantha]|uniref:Uncharacterized protein n=1 Tax=Stephania cephalantha TaxID=152367 RepID=A0AAP0KTP5_9MAGN
MERRQWGGGESEKLGEGEPDAAATASQQAARTGGRDLSGSGDAVNEPQTVTTRRLGSGGDAVNERRRRHGTRQRSGARGDDDDKWHDDGGGGIVARKRRNSAVARCRTDRSLTRGAIRRSSTTRWRERRKLDEGADALAAAPKEEAARTGGRVATTVDGGISSELASGGFADMDQEAQAIRRRTRCRDGKARRCALRWRDGGAAR